MNTHDTSAPAQHPSLAAPTLLVEQFLAEHDVSNLTRDGYRRRLRQFFRWCEEQKTQTADRATILSYKRHLQNHPFSASTISAYLVAVRCFFAWAESVKLHPNVAKGIKGAKREKGFRKDSLTLPQVHSLLESIERNTLQGKRDFALINLMIRTGPRTIETIRANVEDIRQQGGETVLWLQGKGSDEKDAFVVLTESSLRPIQEYLAARGTYREGEALFGSLSDGNRHQRMTTRSIRRIVKTRFRGIQLESPRLTSHSCRHTAVTLALTAGSSLQETQQFSRHTSINTTLIYSHNLERSAGIPEKKIDELLRTS